MPYPNTQVSGAPHNTQGMAYEMPAWDLHCIHLHVNSTGSTLHCSYKKTQYLEGLFQRNEHEWNSTCISIFKPSDKVLSSELPRNIKHSGTFIC